MNANGTRSRAGASKAEENDVAASRSAGMVVIGGAKAYPGVREVASTPRIAAMVHPAPLTRATREPPSSQRDAVGRYRAATRFGAREMENPVTVPTPPLTLAALRVVAVGSTNPVKVAAARAVIGRVAPSARVEAVSVTSTVAEQPYGDDETIRGAVARARAARDRADAELGIGIEGGVVESADGALRTCAWAAVSGPNGFRSVGGSLAMPLPPRVAELVQGEGLELGTAMDRLTGERETKRGRGAVGILTDGLVDRQAAYEVILVYALAPLLSHDLW